MQRYWEETVSIWPELSPYHDQVQILYAGLSPGESVLNTPVEEITNSVKLALSQGKKILFYGIEEGFIQPVLYKIQSAVEPVNFNPSDIVYTTSAVDGQEVYNKLVHQEGWTKPMTIASGYYFERTNFHASMMQVPEYVPSKKEKLFTCFNRSPRTHRSKLLAEMFKYNLVKQAYYSFEGSFTSTKLPIFEADQRLLNRYKHLLPLHLDITEDTDNPAGFTEQDLFYHTNSYFSLITETAFSPISLAQSTIFISEKTFRAVLYKHPFIVVSRPGTLAALRDAGYKTFSPLIDETYDIIKDDDARLAAIVKEVLKLSEFTDADWELWQSKVKDIVDYNYSVFAGKKDYRVTKDLDRLFKLA